MISTDRKATEGTMYRNFLLTHCRKKAYENRFARWGPDFKRKRDASLWAVVGSKVQKRDKLNKKSSVTIKGELIPKGKLYKEISRHHFPSHEEKYGQGTVILQRSC